MYAYRLHNEQYQWTLVDYYFKEFLVTFNVKCPTENLNINRNVAYSGAWRHSSL